MLVGKELRKNPVLGRPEDGAMDPHKDQDGPSSIVAEVSVEPKCQNRQEGNGDLGNLAKNNDFGFAVSVRKVAGQPAEQDKRKGKSQGRPALTIVFAYRSDPADGHQEHELFVEVVVERAEELGDGDPPERAVGQERLGVKGFLRFVGSLLHRWDESFSSGI